MFVDENGLLKRPVLAVNYKASAIYANATAARLKGTTYDDLDVDPPWSPDSLRIAGFVIVGTALLWLGELE